jgi:hypothetical protein
MTTTLTPVSQWVDVVAPEDGELADAASIGNGADQLAQNLLDRDEYLYDQMPNGLMLGGARLEALVGTPGTLRLAQIRHALLGGKAYDSGGDVSLTSANVEGGGGYVADQMLYAYAFVSGAALAYQLSLTPPESGLVWKDGAVGTYRYLGPARTNSSGGVMYSRYDRGHLLFDASRTNPSELLVLSLGSAIVETQVDLAAGGQPLVPPHARAVLLKVSGRNTSGADRYVRLRTASGGAIDHARIYVPAASYGGGTGDRHDQFVWMPVDDTTPRSVWYLVNDATDFTVSLYVYGWQE